MSTQTRETSTKTMEERLGQVGRKIDQAKTRADSASQEAKARVGQRIDALRARKAQLQTRLREARAADELAWEAAYVELNLELDEADAEMAIIDASSRPSTRPIKQRTRQRSSAISTRGTPTWTRSRRGPARPRRAFAINSEKRSPLCNKRRPRPNSA